MAKTTTNDNKTMWTNPKNEWTFAFKNVDLSEEQTAKIVSNLQKYKSNIDQKRIDAYDSSIQDGSLAKFVG